jgi:RimJ/RimL family protein N-acetyltransferase
MTISILTDRLTLRQFKNGDIQDILEFISHPSVARAAPEIGPSPEEVRKYIEVQNSRPPFEQDKCTDLVIERKKDGKVIGLVSMVPRAHHKASIGYALGVKYRGRGYATEAARALMEYGFEVLKYHRIQAETSTANPASYRVMERLGMRPEGQLREAEQHDGIWIDILYYGILATEFKT